MCSSKAVLITLLAFLFCCLNASAGGYHDDMYRGSHTSRHSSGSEQEEEGISSNNKEGTCKAEVRKHSSRSRVLIQKKKILGEYRPSDREPDFLIPKHLEPDEMVPIRFRNTLKQIDGKFGETYAIGFPPQLLQELQHYVQSNGIMDLAKQILYEDEENSNSIKKGEHRLYTMNDGNKFGAMIPVNGWNTDMVWFDPADEECFEALLAVLRKGGFSSALEQVVHMFDLDGLVVLGVGIIFLSHHDGPDNMHEDVAGGHGAYYNLVGPIHIPENEDAKLFLGEDYSPKSRYGLANFEYNTGFVIGGEAYHGTGPCDYRPNKDFRMSFTIYVADLNEDNVHLIKDDDTALWPDDMEWFMAQERRFFSSPSSTTGNSTTNTLANDKGRKPLRIRDKDADCPNFKHLCETDLSGKRLKCPETCKLYMDDEEYYTKFFHSKN